MDTERASSIATVMFTDVEASTELTTRMGDDAAAALFAAHHRIVRDLIAAHHGRNVVSTGDGFMVLFDSSRGALACALAIERELATSQDGIRVRIGLNAGEVLEGDDELFGAAINLAKRVMDRADGGQILITDGVRQLVGTVPDASFRDRGRFSLKGFPERVRLHEVRAAGPRPPPRTARRRRRRGPLLAGAGALAAVAAVAAIAVTRDGEDPVDVLANSVAILDPDAGRVISQVPVGTRPSAVAVGAGSVWVSNLGDNTVTQIGARSRRVVGTVTPGINVDGVGAGPSGLWVADNKRSIARQIDPAFRSVARSVPLGALDTIPSQATRPLAVTDDAVWITRGAAEIARVEPGSGRVGEPIAVGNSPSGVAAGAGAVWVSDEDDGTVTRIDPRTNEIIATIGVGQSASGIAVGGDGVWVTVPLEDRVKRIDPSSDTITDTVRVGGGPAAVAIGGGAVWVTSRRGGTVTRIDPVAGEVTGTFRLGHSPQGVAVVGGAVWIAVQESPPPPPVTAGRADVLTSLRPGGLFRGTDPAFAQTDQLHYATCALLLNYPDEPFPAGAELRPEIARSMPEVSDGGRTYTFRLRSGYRFSPPSNEPVTAHAFRRAIERGLHPRTKSFAATFMGDIVGFRAYSAGRATRLAGVTARGETLTIRLTTASPTLPSRLASPFFCAVPPATPISPAGVEQIPSAGPYYVSSYQPERRLVLRRNPNYGGDRPARLREIDVELDVGRARAVAAVEAGRADHTNAVAADKLESIDRRFGPGSAAARAGRQRYFSGTAAVLHFFMLNARRPLFADGRMRRAVNLALDRRALARRVPFPDNAPGRATDQFIPPGLPGFRDEAIYPLGGPDVKEALRAAGPRRPRRATLYTCNNPACLEQGRIVRRNLGAIGIDVEVENLAFNQMFSRYARRGEPWDIGANGWLMDFADASNFVAPLFTPQGAANAGGFRDEDLARRIRAAERLADAARAPAFAQLDAELARAGAAVPYATAITTELFSDRIGCQVQQPLYGISLGALCIRR